MTIKEIAEKILMVFDMRESSFRLVPGLIDRAGKVHGEYTKTIKACFYEVFGDEIIYYPYYLAVDFCTDSIKSWAKTILKE